VYFFLVQLLNFANIYLVLIHYTSILILVSHRHRGRPNGFLSIGTLHCIECLNYPFFHYGWLARKCCSFFISSITLGFRDKMASRLSKRGTNIFVDIFLSKTRRLLPLRRYTLQKLANKTLLQVFNTRTNILELLIRRTKYPSNSPVLIKFYCSTR